MSYNLKKQVQDYLEIDDHAVEALYKSYPKFKIHMSLSKSQGMLRAKEDVKKKRNLFKRNLIS